jgi:hypothetical protein
MRCAGYVARNGENLKGRGHLEDLGFDGRIMKMDLKEFGCEVVD